MFEGLGIDFRITNDLQEFKTFDAPKLNYSDLPLENCFSIKPHAILFDHGIRDYNLHVKSDAVFKKIFFQCTGVTIPFDIFGASFWLLSRYEEYLPHKSDSENRFSFKSSLAYQYDFINFPLVNLWLFAFKEALLQLFPQLQFTVRAYNFVSTIDIDNVYKYKHKGFVRTMAGFVSDKSFAEQKQRIRILLSREKDPFDCYDFLIDLHKQLQTKALYFFLLGDYGPNDKNHSSTDLRFQSLIKHIADYSMVGLHPSYGSNDHLKQLRKEINRLGNITHKLITKSRQHFAMLKFPHTYKDLLQAEIYADYSLGYPNYNGFRASYCYPYKWYSLEIESVSSLTLHPFCLSEVTLFDDAIKSGESKMKSAVDLMNEVKKYNGEFISIFHNNTFTEEVKKFYSSFIRLAMDPNLLKDYLD